MNPRPTCALAACLLVCLFWARAAADTQEHRLQIGGQARTFRLHVPPGHDSARPSALVVVLHGGGGTAQQVERHTGFSSLADRKDFLVVYPQGLGKQWNDGREISSADDVAFITAVIDRVAREHAVDPRRVYATGISNGGFMCSRLAAGRADRFAAIAPVVGGIPRSWAADLQPAKPLSVLIIQGTDDPLVPFNGGQVRALGRDRGEFLSTPDVLAWWRRVDGLRGDGTSREISSPRDPCIVQRTTWTGGREGTALDFYKVVGGGHAWPGASQRLPASLVGRACQAFDATETIWAFFEAHPRH